MTDTERNKDDAADDLRVQTKDLKSFCPALQAGSDSECGAGMDGF